MTEIVIDITRMDQTVALFGNFDSNIDIIRGTLGVTILVRDNEIKVSGNKESVSQAKRTIESLLQLIDSGQNITSQNVEYMLSLVKENKEKEITQSANDIVAVNARGTSIRAKTTGQQEYVDQIRKNTITLGVGPAGTGKTYLAVAVAAKSLRNNKVEKIILTRPAVEAGEKLGFLPGDLQMKVDPYLRPLQDALIEMFGAEPYAKHIERGTIEIAPLAYMRGRTLNDSFIILDEAQNTTQEQMKMFLTRLGFNAKIVITGDVTQIDLPNKNSSGLLQAAKILEGIDDIGIVHFDSSDVVRHRLVQKIILAYERFDEDLRGAKNEQ